MNDLIYTPLDQPLLCERHGCVITVGGCPECRAEAMDEAGTRLSEELMHA